MRGANLRERLGAAPIPAADEAAERAWRVALAAFEARPASTGRRRARSRWAVAIALGLLALALGLSPAGAKVADLIRDVIEPGKGAQPSLDSLPAPGRLLVDSPRGTWIVEQDGSKRLLGTYEQAAWSPSGLYAAAARESELTAVVADPAVAAQPSGTPHWTVSRGHRVTDPAWAPSGILIAYLGGHSLHVVEGDGTPDRVLDPRVLPVAPAWMPDPSRNGNVLAYVDTDHRVRVVDLDGGEERWRSPPFGGRILSVEWSADGRALAVVGAAYYAVLDEGGRTIAKGSTGGRPQAAAFAPGGATLALARRTLAGTSQLVLIDTRARTPRERLIASEPGHFATLAWSPDGDWLLTAWRDADTWLFVRPSDREVIEYSEISRQFAPGSTGPVGFPRPAGWCCAATP